MALNNHIKAYSFAVIAAVVILLSGCDHKELCRDHWKHAPRTDLFVRAAYQQEWQIPLDGGTDWKQQWPDSFGIAYDSLTPPYPEGLRVQAYNDNEPTNPPVITFNESPEGGVIELLRGENELLFYNNGTEYIVFDSLNTFASAKATTRTRTRVSYQGNMFVDHPVGTKELTVGMPDMLYGNFCESYVAVPRTTPDTMDVTLHPLVFSYLVRFEADSGFQYVALARGALAGMAAGVQLGTGKPSSEVATVLFDCTPHGWGAQAVVRTFGCPGIENPGYTRAEKYGLNLEVRLGNGKMLSFDFDVSEQVRRQPYGGVITVGGFYISAEDGKPGSGDMDIVVEDWGEFEDIIIDL